MNRLIAILIGIGLVLPSLAMGSDGDEVCVAFIRAKEDERGVFHGTLFVKTIGGTERQITTGAVNAQGPIWSPDGTKIAFSDSKIDTDGSVFSIVTFADPATGNVVSTALRGGVSDMTDEYVTYTFVKGATTWVGVARHDGTERTNLVPDADSSSLSSDGSRVLFQGLDGIDIINRDGTGRRTLVRDPLISPVTPRFAGNDEYIVYEAYRGASGREDPHVLVRRIETGEEADLGFGGLVDVVGDWIVMGAGHMRWFAVSLSGDTRFELPWRERGAVHGDLSTLVIRAVSPSGKLSTTWAAMKIR
ncbi:MAG: hypothetical protein O3A46_10335 [Candidatus Poribacteria bacterium]|nr:hypothetical protein [Candidatus Poribacteria bacterium]